MQSKSDLAISEIAAMKLRMGMFESSKPDTQHVIDPLNQLRESICRIEAEERRLADLEARKDTLDLADTIGLASCRMALPRMKASFRDELNRAERTELDKVGRIRLYAMLGARH